MSKKLIFTGCLIILIGLAWPYIEKFHLGRLPGDIMIKRGDFRFYFPITTCLLLSGILSIILWLFRK